MRYFLDMADGGPFAIPMTSLLTDEQLMLQVMHGDSTAFRQLAGRHLGRAYAIAFRLLHNREDAEEVAQEAASKVWQRLPASIRRAALLAPGFIASSPMPRLIGCAGENRHPTTLMTIPNA